MQTKLHSLIESCINILIGFGISMVATLWILPKFGYDVSINHSFYITVCFTVISLIRSYVLRRIFNKIGK